MDVRSIPTWKQAGADASKGTPERVGQTYFATDTNIGYIATGTASASDWHPAFVLPDSKGYLMVSNADGLALLQAGADSTVLQCDSAEVTGFKFINLGAATGKKRCKMSGFALTGLTANTPVDFNTEVYDNDTMIDLATHNTRITIKTAGVYRLIANGKFQHSAIGGTYIYFRKNGSGVLGKTIRRSWSSENQADFLLVEDFELAANDYIEVMLGTFSSGVARYTTQADWSFSASEL